MRHNDYGYTLRRMGLESFPQLNYVDIGQNRRPHRTRPGRGFADGSFGADGRFADRLLEQHNVVG